MVESYGTGRSIFCGVNVAREVSGRLERRGEKSSGKTGLVTVVSFEPSMLLTNLLATPADVVLSRPSRGSGVNGDSLAACLSFGKVGITLLSGRNVHCLDGLFSLMLYVYIYSSLFQVLRVFGCRYVYLS